MDTDSRTVEAMGKHGHLRTYVIGLILSLILTLAAYFIVTEGFLSGKVLDLVISAFAVVQVYIQLVYFLHLGDEPKPYWNLIVFLFMALVVLILVSGTLWIMYHLEYRTMEM